VAAHDTYLWLSTFIAHPVPRTVLGLSEEGRFGLDLAQNREDSCGVLYIVDIVEATMRTRHGGRMSTTYESTVTRTRCAHSGLAPRDGRAAAEDDRVHVREEGGR
jgi:hypothetical protein